MTHDLFRYVPQIEQTGLPVDPRVMALLVERDRQLEDYLSKLHPGGEGWIPRVARLAAQIGFTSNPQVAIAGQDSPWVTQLETADSPIANNAGVVTMAKGGFYQLSGIWFCGNWFAGSWSVAVAVRVNHMNDPVTAGYEVAANFDAGAIHYTTTTHPSVYELTVGDVIQLYCARTATAPAGGEAYLDIVRVA